MSQIYREYLLRVGLVVVRGHKARLDVWAVFRAVYALFFKTNIYLAVVEAIVARVTELRRLCVNLRQRLDRSSAMQTAPADAMIGEPRAA